MKSMKPLLLAASALAFAPAVAPSALANGSDHIPFAFHDILITGPQPVINISVRNMAASTDPDDRDLRVTASNADDVGITGQIWCSNPDTTEALRAQIIYGQVIVHGNDLMGWGAYSPSEVQNLPGNGNLKNFDIAAPLLHADQAEEEGLFGGFNPVNAVENRLESFLDNNAGGEADFLRVDDVFELDLRANAVGWCDYQSQNIQGEYVGFQSFDVKVRIFYHGDEDIQDVITTVGQPGSLAAPVPSRARGRATTRGAETAPPARSSRPARATPARSGRDNKALQDRAPSQRPAADNSLSFELCDPLIRRTARGQAGETPARCTRDQDESAEEAAPVDALRVINEAAEPESEGETTALDALMVINHARQQGDPDQ